MYVIIFMIVTMMLRTQFQHQDNLVPWKLKQSEEEGGDQVFMRYYHVFEEGELELLVKEVEGLQVRFSITQAALNCS